MKTKEVETINKKLAELIDDELEHVADDTLRAVSGGNAKNNNVYIDVGKCTGCGFCVNSCPVECIQRSGHIYAIITDKCIRCGCCVYLCPVNAIIIS